MCDRQDADIEEHLRPSGLIAFWFANAQNSINKLSLQEHVYFAMINTSNTWYRTVTKVQTVMNVNTNKALTGVKSNQLTKHTFNYTDI